MLTWSAMCAELHCGVMPADDCCLRLNSADDNAGWLEDEMKVVAKLICIAFNLFTMAETV